MKTAEELIEERIRDKQRFAKGSVWEYESLLRRELKRWPYIGYWLSINPKDNKLLEMRLEDAGWKVGRFWIFRWVKI
jgi:hypothetical protein